jgi:hypothetical protein
VEVRGEARERDAGTVDTLGWMVSEFVSSVSYASARVAAGMPTSAKSVGESRSASRIRYAYPSEIGVAPTP